MPGEYHVEPHSSLWCCCPQKSRVARDFPRSFTVILIIKLQWQPNKDEGVIKPILKPMAVFFAGGLLALGHHIFNSYADNKPL